MLVLTRKVGERIQIGNDITVVVTKTAGGRVTLGIEAPKDVRIMRGELEEFANSFGDEDSTSNVKEIADDESDIIAFPFVADACTFVPTQAR